MKHIHRMDVDVKGEAGFEQALEGLSYNHFQQGNDMLAIAKRLAPQDYGHNKFLEAIMIWVSVKAPRYWWQEADTYRISTKQSESTMHIHQLGRPIVLTDFIGDIEHTTIARLNYCLTRGKYAEFKMRLPESFLQRRMWMISYKTLRNIFIQRQNHRLPEWRLFLHSVLTRIEHPEFIDAKVDKWLKMHTIAEVMQKELEQ